MQPRIDLLILHVICEKTVLRHLRLSQGPFALLMNDAVRRRKYARGRMQTEFKTP